MTAIDRLFHVVADAGDDAAGLFDSRGPQRRPAGGVATNPLADEIVRWAALVDDGHFNAFGAQ